jgi:hypothetical protein
MPTLLVWGAEDPIIPVAHGAAAHEAMPGSRFEVFERSGHFPQLSHPRRFARLLREFLDSTEAAWVDTDVIREQLVERGRLSMPVPPAEPS